MSNAQFQQTVSRPGFLSTLLQQRWFFYVSLGLVMFGMLVVASGAWWVYAQVKRVGEMKIDCYCMDMATFMVIEHMRANHGEWPRGWEALDDDFATVSTKISGWTPQDIKSRVEIDWNASPQELTRAKTKYGKPPFTVIWLRNGQIYHFDEPNQAILDYLQTGKSKLDSSPACPITQ